MMKRLTFSVLLFAAPVLLAQTPVERSVLEKISQIHRQGGRISFSELYNNDQFNQPEKAFLGKLYEVFFGIPSVLRSQQEGSQTLPSRQELAERFGISKASVELLLSVMESDRRVPPMFTRSPETREIVSLNLPNIAAFLKSKGAEVKMSGWEGQQIPSFSLEDFDGKQLSDQDLSNHPALLYFWFTGCPPCVRMAPILKQLRSEYASSDLQFIGFNADKVLEIETEQSSRIEYLRKQGIDFRHANLDAETRAAFGNVNVFPTLFLIDGKGRITRHLVNFQDLETLTEAVVQLLDQ